MRRITATEYDKYYTTFRNQLTDAQVQLSMLQDADNNYYYVISTLVDIASRASKLFERSKVDEKRRLIKLVLSNLRIEGKKILYDVLKPFDLVVACNDSQSWGG